MNALPHGVEQGLDHLHELASYLGAGLLALVIGLGVVPFVIWWNTARTNRLLNQLIDEQEKTNALLEELVTAKPADKPEQDQDFTLS